MSYSHARLTAYTFPAATLSSAAIIGRFMGPAGKQGVLVDVTHIVTTGITVAANTVDVGITGDVAAYGTATQAIAAADEGGNGAVLTGTRLAADTVIEVSTNGECTAGAADVTVLVEWE